MTLTDFLLARITEDEEQAKLSAAHNAQNPNLRIPSDWIEQVAARVLAECEAKRRIVEDKPADRCDSDYRCHAHEQWEQSLRLLALPYADHPDYRREWKP